MNAPVVQWIEYKFPELTIQVRFLSGAQQNKNHPLGWFLFTSLLLKQY